MDLADREAEKYRKVYQNDIYRIGPGVSHAPVAVEKLGMKAGESVIDFGCGGGYAAIHFQDCGLRVLGTDIADSLEQDFFYYVPFVKGAIWDLDDLPVADYAFSSHVLEHVPPEKVDDTLRVIEQHTAKGAYLNIFHLPATMDRWFNETLHLTVEPYQWWQHRIEQYFHVLEVITTEGKNVAGIKESVFVVTPKNAKASTEIPAVKRPQSNETVVIVGHGPSAINGGLGEKIEHHDNIIRFAWRRDQPPKDYGSRVDYIVASLRNHGDIINEGTVPVKGSLIFGRPGQMPLETMKGLKSRLKKFKPGFGREVWPWHCRYRDLGATGYIDPRQGEPGLIPSFSQGTGAIIMACVRIAPSVIHLVGFDNVWAGKQDGYNDWNAIRRGEAPRKSGHDLRVERILIDELMKFYDVEIRPL